MQRERIPARNQAPYTSKVYPELNIRHIRTAKSAPKLYSGPRALPVHPLLARPTLKAPDLVGYTDRWSHESRSPR